MAEIKGTSSVTGKFAPTVRLLEKGQSIKGEVVSKRDLPLDSYGYVKPCISLKLIDLSDGASTQLRVGKGEYQEVTVAVGDVVDFIGSGTDLMEKLPQLEIGNIVTITNNGLAPKGKGRNPKKLFKVEVE